MSRKRWCVVSARGRSCTAWTGTSCSTARTFPTPSSADHDHFKQILTSHISRCVQMRTFLTHQLIRNQKGYLSPGSYQLFNILISKRKFQTAIPPAVSEWHCFETISRSDVKRTIFDQYKMYICIQTVQNVQNVCTKCTMYIISNCKP